MPMESSVLDVKFEIMLEPRQRLTRRCCPSSLLLSEEKQLARLEQVHKVRRASLSRLTGDIGKRRVEPLAGVAYEQILLYKVGLL